MEAWQGLFRLTFLCFLLHVRGEYGDFDLADALDDPEPTKKPSSGIYPNPRPPYHPQPGNPDNSGNIYPRPKPPYHPQPGNPDTGGNIYPRPKPPPPRPQPGNSGGFLSDSDLSDGGHYPPKPPAGGGGGGGYRPGHDSYGRGGRNRPGFPGTNYGGGGYSTPGNQQGNMIAQIASPIVSVVVVTLIGAAVSYYNRRRNCLRTNEPRTV
ncbi:glycoprotein Xg isoform X1 [Cervus elaphus]|uniref:glycoprotein Xg isoform X1 n=1 Tax=Cervus elaphus TaxID=9860 RepID=UPI001CC28D4B|nr:glycoprotein Xg isoform X1 [Cervus elaphus]